QSPRRRRSADVPGRCRLAAQPVPQLAPLRPWNSILFQREYAKCAKIIGPLRVLRALSVETLHRLIFAVSRCPISWGFPALNIFTISRLNAGRSSGFRLVTMLPSTTTSRSTHLAPAFLRSVFTEGHDVIVRPRTTSASTSVHGPWQIAA